jgi:hypothetical protein
VAAGEHGLGFEIEGAQQLALPAVPDPGADGADVATVRIRSSLRRSGLCTMAAKSRMVLKSLRSRIWAKLLMTR